MENNLINIDEYELSDALFDKFSKLAYQKSGIYLKPTKKILVSNRLRKRIRSLKIKGFKEYYDYISSNPEEIIEFINAISTNETFFFRNRNQLDVLKNKILPLMMKKKETIKIWSAGCSTGEEPYSIAMVADMINVLFKVEIIATDINTDVIKQAKTAVYNERKLRGMEDEAITEYFDKSDNGEYAVKQFLKKNIRFVQHNLVLDQYIQDVDVIFCRNVMIYFERETQKYIVQKFYESLNRGGFLFLGHAETLYVIPTKFKYLRIEDASVYFKE